MICLKMALSARALTFSPSLMATIRPVALPWPPVMIWSGSSSGRLP
jgi:hypothetical protein